MRTAYLTNPNGLLAIMELDNNLELAELLGLDLSLTDNLQILEKVHEYLISLQTQLTGIILDPIYSFHLLGAGQLQKTICLRLEQDKSVTDEELPSLFPNFSLEEIKNNYALVKLALTYNSREELSIAKKQLLSEIRSYSKSLDIDFLLKLRVPTLTLENEFDASAQQLEAVQDVRALADILVLECPNDPLAVATISSELDVPWLVTSGTELSYDEFKARFRMAMENGASGYCLGSLLLAELSQFRADDQTIDLPALKKYIDTVLRDRLIELNRIASEGMEMRL
jgi:tagatose-1,6-bisphosphate aldolase